MQTAPTDGPPLPRRGIFSEPDGDTTPLGTILLVHGFGVLPSAYAQLITLWVNDGWTVYAPRVYNVFNSIGSEINPIVQCLEYAHANLPAPLILAGHSRGGQAALLTMLPAIGEVPAIAPLVQNTVIAEEKEKALVQDCVKGVLLLDPVEGRPGFLGRGLNTVLLQNKGEDWIWNDTPVLIIGAKLGTQRPMPAAPPGHNYNDIREAFRKVKRTASVTRTDIDSVVTYAELADFGHLDYLNDNQCTGGIVPIFGTVFVKRSSRPRSELREFCQKATKLAFGTVPPVPNLQEQVETFLPGASAPA